MANTTFSGPVLSTNGFQGDVTQATQVVTASLRVTDGAVVLVSLPTSDPSNAGQLWVDVGSSNVLKVSTGA